REGAELNFAFEVQQALFPRQFPSKGGLEFAAVCQPARGISGDYYDVLPLSDGRVAFALADISGKGISAAILLSNLHAVLRTLARTVRMPGQLCSELRRVVLVAARDGSGPEILDDMTLLLARVTGPAKEVQ